MLRGQACALAFVCRPVVRSPRLSSAITAAFVGGRDPLALDSLVVQVAEGLLEADPSSPQVSRPRQLDVAALHRARAFLAAAHTRMVGSAELEAVSGLTRYELARQFRVCYGTSLYRYLLTRRLDRAREQIAQRRPLVDVALDAGFADQAHCARQFNATFGLTPARYRALRLQGAGSGSYGR